MSLPPPPPVSRTPLADGAVAEDAAVAVAPELDIPSSPTYRKRRPSTFVRAFKQAKGSLTSIFASLSAANDLGERSSLLARLLNATPAWMVSMIFHMGLVLILGLVAVGAHQVATEEMAIAFAPTDPVGDEIYAETLGEQLEVPNVGDVVSDSDLPFDPTYSLSSLPAVDDPFAAPPKLNDVPGEGSLVFSDIDAPSIGMALSGRQEGRKEALMKAYGGTRTTQESVTLALAWIARQQGRDGSWSLRGPYDDGAMGENRLAATAMALIAFLGDGHTHLKDGPYRRHVQRGVAILIRSQGSSGEFVMPEGSTHHRLYTHAQCTIAICELYAMTEDSQLREHAQKAIEYCVKIQSPEGGWRYVPGQDSDTSVTGWFVMALQSARMAKLEVPSETLVRVGAFLDTVASSAGSRYSYVPGQGATPPMTAEALLCRQYLGWKRDSKKLLRGVDYVAANPVDWQKRNVYYWYYATQVMHHLGGEHWVDWNRVMRQTLPEKQLRKGRERGSWDPANDQWGTAAGRLYVTCLSTYMLEVYYRHLPLYSHSGEPDVARTEVSAE